MQLYGQDSTNQTVVFDADNPYDETVIATPGLVDSVYVETGRPDLIKETLSAVVASTLRMHSLDLLIAYTAHVEGVQRAKD